MKPTLIVITGPTAVGKTSTAIEMALALGSDIISADSRQFYKELKIGVASPTEKEMQAVPHHFVGHLSVTDYYNVSKFEKDVLGFLDDYFKNNQVAVMVGGSGLYIDAVCKGIDDFPDPEVGLRRSLKQKLQTEGIESLRDELQKVDPDYFAVVDIDNPNRILRALEVFYTAGKPFSELRRNTRKSRTFNTIKIALNRPRSELFERIHQRVDQMIEEGLIDEVKSLEKYRNENSLNTVGYKEIFKYLDGEWGLELAIEKIKTHTRRYAKRQLTWFQKDDQIKWFQPRQGSEILEYIQDLL
ncbi:MAG: tRNA (adenosine(37)-N6)-dimethylallyltransferase MiaA [Bacteroidetes bacterium]|nr:tRNA (adenosine(37)-N6)-dimethylallyltransferase MiaA [Bacteroidota bacterium]